MFSSFIEIPVDHTNILAVRESNQPLFQPLLPYICFYFRMFFYVQQAMALADMGRVDDTLPILRTVLDIDSPLQKDKHTFFQETVCYSLFLSINHRF